MTRKDTGKISDLTLTDEPFISNRPRYGSKYDEFFATISPNKRIKMPTEQVHAVSQSLRHWLRKNKKQGVVTAISKADDGMGGVWWIIEAPKAKQAPKEPKPVPRPQPKTAWVSIAKRAA